MPCINKALVAVVGTLFPSHDPDEIFYSKNIPVADTIVAEDPSEPNVVNNTPTTTINVPLAQGIGY